MIGYVTLGTNDLNRACEFFDALFAELGAKRTMQSPRFVAWSPSAKSPAIAVALPFDGKPATVGNGVMVAIAADSRATVDALHAKALALGAQNEGDVGERFPGFYAGYFRDLDGNKLNVFFMG